MKEEALVDINVMKKRIDKAWHPKFFKEQESLTKTKKIGSNLRVVRSHTNLGLSTREPIPEPVPRKYM